MQRPSLSTTRRRVALLVQPSRDDGSEMYTEFLRYHGLAVMPVSDSRDALMPAPQADIVVTGMNLDDRADDGELVSRLRHDALYEVHTHHRAHRVYMAGRTGAR